MNGNAMSIKKCAFCGLKRANESFKPRWMNHRAETVQGCCDRCLRQGVQVYNPAFDVTPHRYLTGIVTENGIVYPPLARNLRRAVRGEE